MATCLFRSPLANRLMAFADIRRGLGRNPPSDFKQLMYIDRFLQNKLKAGEAITKKIIQAWDKENAHLSSGTRVNRLGMMRQFCRYENYFDKRTAFVGSAYFPGRIRRAPYIYTDEEVRAIMSAAQKTGPNGSINPASISTLVGLLYSVGLRVSEALHLDYSCLDLTKGILYIKLTKFKKSRDVPVSKSVSNALKAFLERRAELGLPRSSSSRIFVTSTGHNLGAPGFTTIFLQILRTLGLRGPKGSPGPRIHDFRHSFAVHRLAAWYREGADVNAKLPLLSTYLGHNTVTHTEVYLQATAELLGIADVRFHKRHGLPFEASNEN